MLQSKSDDAMSSGMHARCNLLFGHKMLYSMMNTPINSMWFSAKALVVVKNEKELISHINIHGLSLSVVFDN